MCKCPYCEKSFIADRFMAEHFVREHETLMNAIIKITKNTKDFGYFVSCLETSYDDYLTEVYYNS